MSIKKFVAIGITSAALFVGGGAASAAGDPNSIVDYLESVGKDSSFNSRASLASTQGIDGYRGTAEQNTYLLSKLRGNINKTYAESNQKPQVQNQAQPSQEVKPQAAPAQAAGRTLTVQATAYTAYCEGCSGVTFTGQDLRANPNQRVIAVDPNVIPLGSRVIVEGYGEYLAGDIGGAIKGNRIDIFMPSKEDALSFGRRTLNVTVVQ